MAHPHYLRVRLGQMVFKSFEALKADLRLGNLKLTLLYLPHSDPLGP